MGAAGAREMERRMVGTVFRGPTRWRPARGKEQGGVPRRCGRGESWWLGRFHTHTHTKHKKKEWGSYPGVFFFFPVYARQQQKSRSYAKMRNKEFADTVQTDSFESKHETNTGRCAFFLVDQELNGALYFLKRKSKQRQRKCFVGASTTAAGRRFRPSSV